MPEWITGWTYRKKITIDELKVDADLVDFPVLVKLTSANFDFTKALSTGYDIRFTSSDGTTLLKYERERHDQANSLAEYWVKIPSVSGTVDTDFYIYYRTTDTADGADPTNVWDANFKGVWHQIGASTTLADAKGVYPFTKKSSTEPTEVSGKIYKAQDYDGSDDYAARNDDGLRISTALSMETWMKKDSATSGAGAIIARNGYSVNRQNYRIHLYSDADPAYTKVYAEFVDNAGNGKDLDSDNGTITDTNWHYIAATTDLNNINIYVDGALVKTVALGAWTMGTLTNTNTYFGARYYADSLGGYFPGLIDEIRLSTLLRSAAWIKASYNTGNDSLLIYGSEEQN